MDMAHDLKPRHCTSDRLLRIPLRQCARMHHLYKQSAFSLDLYVSPSLALRSLAAAAAKVNAVLCSKAKNHKTREEKSLGG